jgi:hypothetical protein
MNTLKLVVFLFLITLSSLGVEAQVLVYKPEAAADLLQKHVTVNKNTAGKLMGFYVQICSESGSNSRERAENVRKTFLSKYPKVSAHVSFKEPNFRVRVGDFRTRAEARGFREEIQSDFPQGFVVKDEVKYPKHIISEITK